MKDQSQLIALFGRYLANECSLPEIEELMQYFNSEKSELLEEKILDEFQKLELEEFEHTALPERVFSGIKARISKSEYNPVKRRLWPRFVAAASIAIAVVTGGYFYYKSQPDKNQMQLASNDIDPGKNGATLTLANGKKIYINDALTGNIASEAGVRISKTKDGQLIYEITGNDDSEILTYNTLTTTRGEQSQVRLPDGSLVFLNAESSLRYPTSFARQEKRAVSLSGEAYFEIAKDKSHPFVVSTEQQQVEVLGTHFNINAYRLHKGIKTTLLEGSVRVGNASSKKSSLLVPGQQAVTTSETIAVSDVAVEDAVAWKDGNFKYVSVPLETIMEDVARWYNVEVEFNDPTLKQRDFFVSVTRFDKASKLLRLMEKTGTVSFEIKGNKIIVSGKQKD